MGRGRSSDSKSSENKKNKRKRSCNNNEKPMFLPLVDSPTDDSGEEGSISSYERNRRQKITRKHKRLKNGELMYGDNAHQKPAAAEVNTEQMKQQQSMKIQDDEEKKMIFLPLVDNPTTDDEDEDEAAADSGKEGKLLLECFDITNPKKTSETDEERTLKPEVAELFKERLELMAEVAKLDQEITRLSSSRHASECVFVKMNNNWCEFEIDLNDYPTFKLENAICNHGFFMMAPNLWESSTKTFSRPLRLSDFISSVNVSISQVIHRNCLLVKVHDINSLSSSDRNAILTQVERMLRLSPEDENNVREFQKIHSKAKQKGFGRIFRSPSLFEDAIKCFLLCFCSFQNSLKMAKLLCDVQSELLNNNGDGGKRYYLRNFPNAKEISCLDEETIKKYCKTGLRTNHILEFARKVESGDYDLRELEECKSQVILSQKLKKIKGFGKYASTNVKMCLSFYEDVPVDSETERHINQIYGKKKCSPKVLREIYGKYAPFQCLAFWYELLDYYEGKLGKLSELSSSKYHFVTGSLMATESNSEHGI